MVGTVIVLVYRRQDPDNARFGVVVSKRVGNAVTRNAIKRQLRDEFRHIRNAITESVDIVVIARPSAAKADGATIRSDFRRALQRLEQRAA